MNDEQRKVILDYATELQTNDEPWREFECKTNGKWFECTHRLNPLVNADSQIIFRRRPKTITVTIPVPSKINEVGRYTLPVYYETREERDTALAAIRAEMEQMK